ncbi:MAG: DUF4964 domain-containing protein [Chloroflexi bacterium]|nr:DUF4964 domain-containing protein [Chloroflexota bacterium]
MICPIDWFRSRCLIAAIALTSITALGSNAGAQVAGFRPPAVPLITSDPYLSIWSEADHLTDDVTRHWTHHEHSLVSLIRIDGTPYRLMGVDPAGVPAFPQQSLTVHHLAGPVGGRRSPPGFAL